MINLAALKSAERITDAGEIVSRLRADRRTSRENSGTRFLVDGGDPTLQKYAASALVAESPSPLAAAQPGGGPAAQPSPARAQAAQARPSGSVLSRAVLGFKPEEAELKMLVERRGMPWNPEYVGRDVTYFASDERVDGMGDIVRQSWDFNIFSKNSPMPYSHDWGQPPVGRVIDWEVTDRKEADYDGKALALLGVFATKSDWEWADTVHRLVKARVLVAGSVGFFPKAIIDVKDKEERSSLGLGQFGYVLDDNVLLEYSPCTLPANPGATVLNALKSAQVRSQIEGRDVHFLRELLRQDTVGHAGDKKRWATIESALLAAARSFWPKERFEYHRDLDVPVLLELPSAEPSSPAPAPAPAAPAAAISAEQASQMLKEIHESSARCAQAVSDLTAAMASVTTAIEDCKTMLEDLGAATPSEDSDEEPDAEDPEEPAEDEDEDEAAKARSDVWERISKKL